MQFQRAAVKRRDLRVAKRDIENLLSQGYRVQLRGTEILLNPEYLSLFPLIGQAYLQTNGALLHQYPSLFRKLKGAMLRTIMLTYPIEPEGLIDMPESVIQDVIRAGSGNGFGMVVNILVTKGIVKLLEQDPAYFAEICDTLIDMGAHELRFARLIPFTREQKRISPSLSETETIIRESFRLEARYDGRFDITRAGQMGSFDLRRKLKREYLGVGVPSPNESHIMDCPGGAKLFVVDLDDRIYPCLYLRNWRWAIGTFANGEIILEKSTPLPGALHVADCPAYVEQHNQNFEV